MDALLYLTCGVEVLCYENDNDAFIPERWAQESLAILEENMVVAAMVHRDFSNDVANFGDVVNTRRPGEFAIRRKTDSDEVSEQDASATNVQVPLDQHIYTSFIIKDGEQSKSFKDLVQTYAMPAMQTIARAVDRAILGRAHAFLGNASGKLGDLSASTSKDYVLEVRKQMNDNKAYPNGRNLVLGSSSETSLLQNELFISAERRGDGGEALENARLGRILGFDTFMSQNVSDVATTGVQSVAGTVTNAASAGTTGSQTVSISGHEVVAGEYVVMAGDNQPTYATASTTSTGDTTAVTLNQALKYAVAAGAAVTVYEAHAVDGAYAVGYSKAIDIDGSSAMAQVGQLISFGTGASRRDYTVIEVEGTDSAYSVYLDRPLELALADDDAAFPGPAGALNLAFHRDAIALVTRPLVLPPSSTGVMAAIASYNDIAMRVTMQYDSKRQGTRVTMDCLAGVAILDERLGAVLLG